MIDEVIWWADPLLEYGFTDPTCLIEDYACWDFGDEETFNLVTLVLDEGIFSVARSTGTTDEPLLLYVHDSHDLMYAARRLRDALAEQRYGGLF